MLIHLASIQNWLWWVSQAAGRVAACVAGDPYRNGWSVGWRVRHKKLKRGAPARCGIDAPRPLAENYARPRGITPIRARVVAGRPQQRSGSRASQARPAPSAPPAAGPLLVATGHSYSPLSLCVVVVVVTLTSLVSACCFLLPSAGWWDEKWDACCCMPLARTRTHTGRHAAPSCCYSAPCTLHANQTSLPLLCGMKGVFPLSPRAISMRRGGMALPLSCCRRLAEWCTWGGEKGSARV